MSIISALLASLMIFLSGVPCRDTGESDPCHDVQHVPSSEEHDDQSAADDCSPFCLCQCCHTPVLITAFFQEKMAYFFVSKSQPIYQSSFRVHKMIDAVWRPPQSA